MEKAIADSLLSSVWLERQKYEQAETKGEEYTAKSHSGLKVEVSLSLSLNLIDLLSFFKG